MNNYTQKIVVGDIHGGHLALLDLFNKIEIKKDNQIIFLGDYADGWSDTPNLIEYLIELDKNYNCIFIRGNHDQLLLDWLTHKEENLLWLKHGGQSSVDAYQSLPQKTIEKHIYFLNNLQPYYLDNQNRLFIHAGFTNPNGIEHEYFPKMFFWDRTLWETALSLDTTISTDSPYYPKRFNLYNEIYIGHTPVTRINKTKPINIANVWNIDTGAAFKGPLTAMDINTKEYWQSRPVFEYYPNEKGRN